MRFQIWEAEVNFLRESGGMHLFYLSVVYHGQEQDG